MTRAEALDAARRDAATWKAKHEALLYQYSACHAANDPSWQAIAEGLARGFRCSRMLMIAKPLLDALAAFDRKAGVAGLVTGGEE